MFNAPVAFNSDVVINNPLSFMPYWPVTAKRLVTTKNGNPAQNAILSAVQTVNVGINFADIKMAPDIFERYWNASGVGIELVKKDSADHTVYHRFDHIIKAGWDSLVLIPLGSSSARGGDKVYEFRSAWFDQPHTGEVGVPDSSNPGNYATVPVAGIRNLADYSSPEAICYQTYATLLQYDTEVAHYGRVIYHFEKDWTLAQIGAGYNTSWWGYAIVTSNTARGLFLVPTPGVFLWLAPMHTRDKIMVTCFAKTKAQDGSDVVVQNPTIVYADEVSQFAPMCNWVPPTEPSIIDFTYNTTDVQPRQYMHFPTNAQWTLSTDTPWITLTCPLAGTGDTKGIRLTTSENTGPARYGRIRADATWMDNGSQCRAYQYLGVVQQAKPEPPPPTPAA